MKISTKIIVGKDYILTKADSDTINESWSLFFRILGRGKGAAAATGKALSSSEVSIAALGRILSPKNAKLINKALEKATTTGIPQRVTTTGPKGDLLDFFVRADNTIGSWKKLTPKEAKAILGTGAKIPNTPGLAVQLGVKGALPSFGAAKWAKTSAAAKAASVGDEVLPGVFKTGKDTFKTKLLSPSGKVIKTVTVGKPVKNLMSSFKNLVEDVTSWTKNALFGVRKAKKKRVEALKSGKTPEEARKIFEAELRASGVNPKSIQRQIDKAKKLDTEAKRLGYYPHDLAGFLPFKRTRAAWKSDKIHGIHKITGFSKALIKDIVMGSVKYASLAAITAAVIIYGLLGVGLGFLEGLGVIDSKDVKDIDVDVHSEDTFIATLEDTEPLFTDEEIDILGESSSNSKKIISSKIRIIEGRATLISENLKSQAELDQERAAFEKKEGGPLSQQFNALTYMSPAKVAHMFGFIMSENRLSSLRKAAQTSYDSFKDEMNSIYRKLRWGDALNFLLAGVSAVTPFFTLITTILAKTFPNVGPEWFKLGMFDAEKYAKDVAAEFMSLNEADWDLFVVPLTYQIMLEAGSDSVDGFSQKLSKYAGERVNIDHYVREPNPEEIEDKIKNVSAKELISLMADIPGDEVKAMVDYARG